MKTVLVTGARGFIGRHLVALLRGAEGLDLREMDLGDPAGAFECDLAQADVVAHLAGVNRPSAPAEYEPGNAGFTQTLLATLDRLGRRPAVVFASSVQADRDNPYGRSKRLAEELLADYAARRGAPVRIFRLPNVFGPGCRPNYNSVVATFCHNAVHGLPLTVAEPARVLPLVYVGDVADAWRAVIEAPALTADCRRLTVEPVFEASVGQLADWIAVLAGVRTRLVLPDLSSRFMRRLYATVMSYYEADRLAYALEQKTDARGSLAEFLKSDAFGQVFVSRTRPGVVRGRHLHRGKVEKFFVLEGTACIRVRRVDTGKSVSFQVRGSEFRVVDIPPGCAHSIENVGAQDLVVLFWSGEPFDPAAPDTHPAEVSDA